MVMSIIMTPPPLIFLLMIHGVYSAEGWVVTYSSSHICALKRSTVTINCTYKYPTGHKITEVFWTKINSPDPPDLSKDSEYRERIQYLGDKQHDCSVRLTDVRHTDSQKYYFRFITDKDKWTGKPGVTLNITDPPILVISISPSGVIVEGDSVTLTCSSESNPPVHIYSWFKENQTSSVGSGNIYIISNIRSDHSGQYKCKTTHTCGEKYSDSVTLNVLYPPRNVSASISSSGVIVEGDSVTLTCSSESNPPANISWFKEGTSVGSGNIYIISNIRSDHSGEYKCKAENELGEKNSTVTLNVLYPPRNVSASISSSGVIVEGESVNLTCSSESNPPVHNYSWFEENQTSSVGSGQTFSISNFNSSLSGGFYCVAQNEVGFQRSDAVSVSVKGNVMFYTTLGGALVSGTAFILLMLVWRIRQVKQRNNSQSQIDHHNPSQNRNKTSDHVYEDVVIADDGGDDSDSISPDYENFTGSF